MIDLSVLWRIVRRRRTVIFSLLAAFLALSGTYYATQPQLYEATGRIAFTDPMQPLMEALDLSREEALAYRVRLLTTRSPKSASWRRAGSPGRRRNP